MKKFRTSLWALTLLLILTPFVHSCLDDEDTYYLSIATLRIAENEDIYFTLDNGEKMYPRDKIYTKLEDGQRVYISFDILEENINGYEYYIRIRGLEKILTKDVITMTEETADSIGDDEINIHYMWFGDGYLNIEFQYKGRRNPEKLHMVNLVRNEAGEEEVENTEEGYINLEFRHNAYDDTPFETLDGIVSFKGFSDTGEQKGLIIRYNSIYDGIKYKKIDFEEKNKDKRLFSQQSFTSFSLPAYY